MRIMNWKTTVGAFVSLLAALAPQVGIEIDPNTQIAMVTVGLFIIGIFAKDKDVTGGKRVQQ